MNEAALWHQCRAPWAYPVREDHVRIVLKAARGDVAAARVRHNDRYAPPPEPLDPDLPMAWLGDDELHSYWGATVPAPTRRLRYILEIQGSDGTTVWLGDSGLVRDAAAANDPFEFAYIHRGDRFETPSWLRDRVFYEIFPDRFHNGDPGNDPENTAPWGTPPRDAEAAQGGDLAGIRAKIDFLNDLGINALYTTPLFKAPSNHKYDTEDYCAIDPAFGGEEDLIGLVEDAHRAGIKVVLDAVINHVGTEFFAYKDVVEKGEQSAYRGWFYDIDPRTGAAESFAKSGGTMPKLDTSNPDCAAYLLKMADYWLQIARTDGWRLDVANEVDHAFWREFRRRVKGVRDDAYILGEVWHDPTPWLDDGDQFDGAMNYPWREATLAFLRGERDADAYERTLTRLRLRHTAEVNRGLLTLLGTHDTARVRTELGGSVDKTALAAILLLTAPGVPMVYYGDEIGLEGAGEVGARASYPWDQPLGDDQRYLRDLHRDLIALRRAHPWLHDGAWETFHAVGSVLGFRRRATPLEAPMIDARPANEASLLVIVNAGDAEARVPLPEDARGATDDLLAARNVAGGATRDGDDLVVPPFGGAILRV